MKCHWINKTWYPDDAYAKFNGAEKLKLFLNQEEQRRREGKPLKARTTGPAPVREVNEMNTVISQLTASVASVTETCNDTAKSLKRLRRTAGYNSDDESLFSDDDDDVAANRTNAALARQAEKRKDKRGRKK